MKTKIKVSLVLMLVAVSLVGCAISKESAECPSILKTDSKTQS